MTITRESLFTSMRTAIKTATGVPTCILADQNKDAPEGEYAAVEPFQLTSGNAQPTITQGSDDTQTIVGNVHVQCVVNFYRCNARERAGHLRYADKRSDVIWALYKDGITWQYVGPINNLSALQSSQVEQRSNVTIFLMFKEITLIGLNTILHAPLSVEYADGTIVYSET